MEKLTQNQVSTLYNSATGWHYFRVYIGDSIYLIGTNYKPRLILKLL